MATDWNALTAKDKRLLHGRTGRDFEMPLGSKGLRNMIEASAAVENACAATSLASARGDPNSLMNTAREAGRDRGWYRMSCLSPRRHEPQPSKTRPRIPRDAGATISSKARGAGLSKFVHAPAGYSRAVRGRENVEKPCAGPWPTVKVGSRSRAPAPRRTATPGATYAPRRCRTRRV